MGIFRQIQISYWQDPFIFELNYIEKYFYLYLISSSKSTQCGIYEITKTLIALETGLDIKTIDELIEKFTSYGKITYSQETNEIFIKNWIKYNITSSPKVIKGVEKELKKVKSNYLKELFYKECKRHDYKINVESKDLDNEYEINNNTLNLSDNTKTKYKKVNEGITVDNKKLEVIQGGVSNGEHTKQYSKFKYATTYQNENAKPNTKPSEEQLRYARELTEDIKRIHM